MIFILVDMILLAKFDLFLLGLRFRILIVVAVFSEVIHSRHLIEVIVLEEGESLGGGRLLVTLHEPFPARCIQQSNLIIVKDKLLLIIYVALVEDILNKLQLVTCALLADTVSPVDIR